MKSFKFLSLSFVLATAGLSFRSLREAAAESSFDYFGSGINYWGSVPLSTSSTDVSPLEKEVLEPSSAPQTGNNTESSFDWDKYTNPKNREFFKEGDYTPPEPFMEIVRSPTDENLKRWFAYIEKRNEFSQRLQKRMKEYVEKSSGKLNGRARAHLQERVAKLPIVMDQDTRRYRFRMYFDSKCPHCKRMFGTMASLQERGYFVEALQVDQDQKAIQGLPIPVRQASKEELLERKIEAVPYLLIGDLKQKVIHPLQGYQSVASIFQALAEADSLKEGTGIN